MDTTCAENSTLSSSKKEKFNFGIYPNPVSSHFRVELDSKSDVKYSILSTQGKRYEAVLLNKNSLDVSALSPGIYILNIFQQDGKYACKKFVKL